MHLAARSELHEMEVSHRKSGLSEAHTLAAIVAGSNDAIITKTLAGVVTSWNPGAERLFGYTAHEMIGHSIFRLIPPHMLEEEKEIIGKIAAGERIVDYRAVRLTHDARRIFVSLAISPLHDSRGHIVGASNIARPLTASSDADGASLLDNFEASVWSNAESRRLAAIVEGSQDAIVGETIQGVVTSWNSAAEKIFGYSAAEIVGQTIDRIIPSYLREEHLEIIARLTRGERVDNYETIRIGKDGRRITISLSASPLRDAAGGIIGASTIARDITLRKEAEDALRLASETAQKARLQTEDAIRAKAEAVAQLKQQARTRAIVETAVDGIILMDSRGRITLFNPACERIFGHSSQDMIGADIKRLMPPPYQDEHDSYLDNFERTGQRKIIGIGREVSGLRKSGESFPLDLSVGQFNVENETYFVGVLRDISERKRAERQRETLIEQLTEAYTQANSATQSLARSERFTTTVIDAIPDLIVYWNADLTCQFANKAYCDWHGLTSRQIVGARLVDVLDDKQAASMWPIVGRALAGERQHYEITRTRANGEIRHLLVDYIPDRVEGKVAGFVISDSDVTSLKATEAALRAEIAGREQASLLLKSSQIALQEAQRLGQIGSWERRLEDTEVDWSDELNRIYDRAPDLPPPSHEELAALYTPECWLQLEDAVERTRATGAPYALELQYFRSDGEKGWVEARGEAVRDEYGVIVGLRGTAQNITSRKQATEQREGLIEQLTAANVERAHFARAASHDLREPLRMVTAYCGRLSKAYGDRLDAKGAEYLSLAVGAASRMSRVLDDLVDFERLAEGARGGWFQSAEAVAGALANIEQRIQESGGTIEVDALPRIWGNPTRFERLIQNLIGNALKYVAPGTPPRVVVSARREQDHWRFSVSDNGIGIEPHHRERIFEPFKRLHARDRYDGTGLGLAICKKIVEGFAGSIWVESNSNNGCTFNFTVKIIADGES